LVLQALDLILKGQLPPLQAANHHHVRDRGQADGLDGDLEIVVVHLKLSKPTASLAILGRVGGPVHSNLRGQWVAEGGAAGKLVCAAHRMTIFRPQGSDGLQKQAYVI
jgi:hypothetical protein